MTDSLPNTPQQIYNPLDSKLVKVADPQYLVVADDLISVDIMSTLIFEDIGGQEIINIDRGDTVFGSNIIYENISNNNKILQAYNSYKIAPISQTSYEYFKNFPISLNSKIPSVGNGEDGSNVYIDEVTGDLVLEFVNLEYDEEIEINIINNGTSYYSYI